MIGQYYHNWGTKRHISHRYGDNKGNPFTGPIQFTYLECGKLLILHKNHTLSIQTLTGAVETNIYPKLQEEQIKKMLTQRNLSFRIPSVDSTGSMANLMLGNNEDDEDNDDDEEGNTWQANYLAQEANEILQPKIKLQTWYLNIEPHAISCFPNNSPLIAIADGRYCIKILNLETMNIVNSFGKQGFEPGEICHPTSIVAFTIGKQNLIALGDSSTNQRVQIYTQQGQFLTSIGSKGPMIGQFRDITSISYYFPTPKRFNQSINRDPKTIHVYNYSYLPKWFKGVMDRETLEDCLYEDQLGGNFVVGQRANDLTTYDLIYVSITKTIVRVIIKEEPGIKPTFYILNTYLGEKKTYESLYELILHQKELHLYDEFRDSMFFAVVDRKNFRIQILRFFWTSSFLYSPKLEVVTILGGYKKMYCDLRDPICVSYSSSKELAICDMGLKSILIFSSNYELLKTLSLPYQSPLELRQVSQNQRQKHSFTSMELENAKRPCWIQYLPHGELAIGYKSGGLYILQARRSSQVGDLQYLELKSLEKIIVDYLTYSDIENLRNTCQFLHDYTRELRYNYKIFPFYRQKMINKIIYLFVRWSRVGKEGGEHYDGFVYQDIYQQPICSAYLMLRCQLGNTCSQSHRMIYYDRMDLQLSKAYLCYDDLMAFISDIFGPKFIWKHEIFIQELFKAYSQEEDLLIRKDPMAKQQVHRQKQLQTTRILYYISYLEILLTLEEHYHGYKHILMHKLFSGQGRHRYLPKMTTNYETLDKKIAYVNPFEQYTRDIHVPPQIHAHGKRIITKKGFENAERKGENELNEHLLTFDRHVTRASDLIHRLFS